MKNVIVDIGNMNIKYLGENKGIFSSKFENGFNPAGEYKERIVIDGVTTYIGTGTLSREYNKVKKNYLPQLLYAIKKATNDTNINLCMLLPIDQLPLKQELIDKLQYKTFKPTINGITTNIAINKVAVIPEGVASVYSDDDYKKDDILLIDLGSRTTNYASIVEGKLEKTWTEKLGIYDMLQEVTRIQNSDGEDLTVEEIERQIKRGRIKVDNSIYKSFLLDVLNRTKGNVNTKNYSTIFSGGGSLTIEDYIKKNTPCKVHSDALYSNVVGGMAMCIAKWGAN